MVFRFYPSQVSQATRSVALWITMAGLMLVGIGLLTYLLRDVIVFFLAALFVFAGIVVMSWGVRLFIAALKIDRRSPGTTPDAYRENVSVRMEHDSF